MTDVKVTKKIFCRHRQSKVKLKLQSAQTIAENVILIGIVAFVFFAIGPLIRRGVQSVVATTADQLAPQAASEQKFDERTGYLVSSNTTVKSLVNKQTREGQGSIQYIYNDQTTRNINTLVNQGVTPSND